MYVIFETIQAVMSWKDITGQNEYKFLIQFRIICTSPLDCFRSITCYITEEISDIVYKAYMGFCNERHTRRQNRDQYLPMK